MRYSRTRGEEWGGGVFILEGVNGEREGKMEWILMCLSPSRPHGGLECMENTSDGAAQTEHTLCCEVTAGVSRHSHGP